MHDPLKKYVQQITVLPTIPVVAQEILRLVHDEKTSVGKLENIVENDPSISAKIMSVSNSAFFGYKTPVDNIRNAILRIGFNSLRDIAYGISLITVFEKEKGKSSAFDYEKIFNHSVTVGMIAQVIARDLKMRFADEIFLYGILHDLGYLVLNRYFSEKYMEVLGLFERDGSLLDAEMNVFNFTHADIGAWLAENWGLPETIVESIRCHHNPAVAKQVPRRVACIHIADHIVSRGLFGVTDANPGYPLELSVLDTLGIKEEYIDTIEQKMVSGELL